MIITNNGPQSIGQNRQFFSHGDLFLSPEEYQRENAWGPAQKQLLVDSIFRGMDIPKFYLWKIDHPILVSGYPEVETKKYYKEILEKKRVDNEEEDPYIFEVVDGQQRIRTILEFMGVKPPNCSAEVLDRASRWEAPLVRLPRLSAKGGYPVSRGGAALSLSHLP